jgi:hypothetical protein
LPPASPFIYGEDIYGEEPHGRHRARRRRLTLPHRVDKALSRELVEDCEAFLAGQFLARAEPRSLAVPVWVWSNVLAHGSPDDIRETAAEGSTAPSGWRAARAYLAAELLELQARGRSLEQLQHDVLVPMELHFAARADARTWTPQRWAAAVRTSIDVYGGSSRL